MRRLFTSIVLTLVLACLPCQGFAKKPEKTSLEIQALQSQTFDTTKGIAFSSVLSVFQDIGYIVESADLETGFITAHSPSVQKRGWYLDNRQTKVTAFVEGFPNGKTKIRINFVDLKERQLGYGAVGKIDSIVEDPLVYQTTFQKIQEAIFIRTPMKTD